jgi:hypothetical protein
MLACGVTEKGRMFYEMYERRFGKPPITQEDSFVIKPSVGRIVLFYNEPGAAVRPAIVVHVWGDPCINIATWDGNGNPVPNPPTSVRLVQPGETLPTSGPYCTWMDYQVGQAAKTEALEKELAAKS